MLSFENGIPKESQTIEYKTAANDIPRDFWDTYSAFANSYGGTIYLGISETKNLNIKSLELKMQIKFYRIYGTG